MTDLQESDWQFAPEVDRLWDALTKRGMHYDRESMEADEPNLAQRHRASLSLALGEGGWVPRSEAEALAEALDALGAEYIGRPDAVLYPARFREADRVLRKYRSRHPEAS